MQPFLLTIVGLLAVILVSIALHWLTDHALSGRAVDRPRFWASQAINVLGLVVGALIIVRVWSSHGAQFGSAVAWLGAGVAVALQRVVTAFAGYLILLRGKVFTIGDRITIGGVRGDVVALGFMQTTVMEMGQASGEQNDDPSMWVRGRQYSGRIVRITNDRIFDTPVFNYTREFAFMWEELMIPVRYGDDHGRVEVILLDAARRHTPDIAIEAREALRRMEGRFFIDQSPSVDPVVYLHMTDNWVELSLRYIARARGNRGLSDAINREVLAGMTAAGIGVASATYDIVGFPAVKVVRGDST